ncbi:hypothetical protein VJ923_01555 [Adlercreutzia sp. R25]|uniref:Uncharacterized protein n=1 Tax=Adlercreutzia shanghongiae TaxID=3111773 RepID=A0ABU6IYC1_9ACTN|nr:MULTISPECIES: hypothetical protein [unclassified Adlercreutzia]MEC4271844.1 hypothetical protein [Adlercreutzia sp. R25]MEC4294851.1 hypothetical protein [Adlercreutzia sp. R22]
MHARRPANRPGHARAERGQRAHRGLYAAGNCSGSFYAATYPELYISNAMGRTLTFARHAILHIKDNL